MNVKLNLAAYWKSVNSEACAKKLSQVFANNIDDDDRGFGLRIFVRYYLKKEMKNKRDFGETWHFL